jgi:hypothetical protein
MPKIFWIDNSLGIYIPKAFARSFASRDTEVTGVSAAEWAALDAGPDHPEYWDAWADVLDNARVKLDDKEYFVHQEGDCWLVPVGGEGEEEEEEEGMRS